MSETRWCKWLLIALASSLALGVVLTIVINLTLG
jgi:hypothetical protein